MFGSPSKGPLRLRPPWVILLLLESGRQDQTLSPAFSCVCVRG